MIGDWKLSLARATRIFGEMDSMCGSTEKAGFSCRTLCEGEHDSRLRRKAKLVKMCGCVDVWMTSIM